MYRRPCANVYSGASTSSVVRSPRPLIGFSHLTNLSAVMCVDSVLVARNKAVVMICLGLYERTELKR